MNPYKTDCFYYTEVHDMGACIPQCKWHKQLGECPCDNCSSYISNKEVSLVIQDYVRNKCEDCISREAVIDLVADYDLNMDQVVRGIHALPSVTPKTNWIPVSERLPKEPGHYLVTMKHNDISFVQQIWYDGEGNNEYMDDFWRNYSCSGITAWMPLPEPYKVKESDS